MAEPSATTTILFTDLVNSTELMQRAGDEDAQRIFRAHYQLLREAVSANGGDELKSLGDGLMVTFASAASALRCAIAMQQAARRPVHGERIGVRIGINAGDALRDADDVFGTPVVIARRLCDRATPGQILCSAVVEGLLAGRQAFAFRDLGNLDLKGIALPVAAREVAYEAEEPGAFLTHTPFVGREAETSRLRAALDEARAGRGGLVMLVGEPGIGKSRMIEEFSETAGAGGAVVLTGHCFEGEWAPSYGPFAEALDRYVKDADPDALREDLGNGGPALARIAPALREAIPTLPDPPPLQPDEERFRLLDAVAQLLIAISQRASVVLVLDDLHWADRGTIAMLRHVARFAPKNRILLLGAYRDVELDRQHPLSDALAALRREAEYERIALKGLDQTHVGALLAAIAEQEVNPALVQAISDETDGNPFFIREVLAHLVEEGKLYREDGAWKSDAQSVAELGIPEGVRQVIGRRVSRLSADANRLLTAASGFNGPFQLDLAAAAASIDEAPALDALDEALQAQLLRPANTTDAYDFTHALIRHTLFGEMSPSRQVRLHRHIAEAMEHRYGNSAAEHAAELAYQYHRSAAIAGAERGVDYALLAARRAQAAYAHDEAAQLLRITLDLLPEDDPRRPRLLARFAFALAWTRQFDDAVTAALAAADAITAAEGAPAAADMLADAALAISTAGSIRAAWRLAGLALPYAPPRSRAWSRLVYYDIQHREAVNPDTAGTSIPLDAPEYDELVEVIAGLLPDERTIFFNASRAEALQAAATARRPTSFSLSFAVAFPLGFQAGEFRRAGEVFRQAASDAEAASRIAESAGTNALFARCLAALGDLDAASATYQHSLALAAKLAGDPLLGAQSLPAQQVVAALDELRIALGTDDCVESVDLVRGLVAQNQLEFQWARSSVDAAAARILAEAGHTDEALAALNALSRRLNRIPAWDANNTRVCCDAAHALWALQRTDHIDVIERNLREKVIVPDFRYPMFDGRRAMAHLCAVAGRFDEARDWFAKARTVLDEQGARPLRAIVDYDEALMYIRRNAPGDKARAQPLLAAATQQFREINMPGWLTRAAKLAV